MPPTDPQDAAATDPIPTPAKRPKRPIRAATADPTGVTTPLSARALNRARAARSAEPDGAAEPASAAETAAAAAPTTPIPVPAQRQDPGTATTTTAARPRRSVLAGCTGVLTAALVVLAAVVVLAEVVSLLHGDPGPGWWLVVLHLLGAGLALWFQRRVDHPAHPAARLIPALGVVATALLVGALLWWSWLWLFWSV
jgi:hypothetical protein